MIRPYRLSCLVVLFFLISSCQQEIGDDFNNPGGSNGGGNNSNENYGWSFTSNATSFYGCVDTAYYISNPGLKILTVEGVDSLNNAYTIILSTTGNFSPTTYNASQGATMMLNHVNGNTYMSGGAASTFSIQLTAINDTLVTGTFSAQLTDPITNATFNLTQGKVKALIGKSNPCSTTPGGGAGGGGTGSAVFTFPAGSCGLADIQGTYFTNVALGSGNTIELDVNVITEGTWTMTTPAVNGITFSGSGTFNLTGLQTITLTGSGTPAATGLFDYNVTAGSSGCSFPITVSNVPAAPCNPDNNTGSFSGVADLTFTNVGTSVQGGSYKLTANAMGGDLTIEFAGTAQPVAGEYEIQPQAGTFLYGDVRVSAVAQSIFWQSNQGSVFVTVNNGKVTAVFCDVQFSGTLGGPSFNTIGEAKISQP